LDLKALSHCCLFDGLNEERLKVVVGSLSEKAYRAGEVIVQEGEVGDELFILMEGEVQITKSLTLLHPTGESDRKDKSLLRLSASTHPFFGEMSLIGKDFARSATVTALTKTEFAVLNRKDFLKLGEKHQDIGFAIIFNIARVLCDRLRKANQDILKLTTAFSLALETGR